MRRFAAFVVLAVPAIAAAYGIKLMRDTLFSRLASWSPNYWLQFLIGLALTGAGLAFFAGFLLNRDRKSGKVQPRFQKKKER